MNTPNVHTYRLDKPVRDNDIEKMSNEGVAVGTKKISPAEYEQALLAKLPEEIAEYLAARTVTEKLEELGDMKQIIHTLAVLAGGSVRTLETHRQNKLKLRGGFKKRAFVTTVTCKVGSKWDKFFADQPGKYHRVIA